MSHYNNIFNKKNVEYSLVNVGDRLPYENKSKVTLNSNQIIFTSINNVLQRLLDNDLYNEALLKQYIDEGKIAGPITITSIEEILNQYDENKKFILSDENGIQVIHKVHVPVSKTLKGRYLDGNKVNKVSFVNDSYVAATNTGYYVSDNKIDWKKEINKAGIDFVDVCYNKNYLIDDKSLLSSFDWIVLGNSANGTELFGHQWLSSGGKWVDFSTDSVLSGFNFSGKIGTHVFSFEKDTKFYVGTKNDGLWSIDGIVGHEPRRENGTNNWTINDFVEIKCDNDYERYFLATNYGVKQSRAIIGFDKLEKIHLFPKNTYVYEAIEKDGAIYAATSNGLAKIKDKSVSYILEDAAYDIVEYEGYIYVACGKNGVWKIDVENNDAVSRKGTVSALKLTVFKNNLFLITASKIPKLKYFRHSKDTSYEVEGFNVSGLTIRDLVSTRNVLYIVTNEGIKCVCFKENISKFEKIGNTNDKKISFSKNVSDDEVIIQVDSKIYRITDVSENLSEETYIDSNGKEIVDAIKTIDGYFFLDSDGLVYKKDFLEISSLDDSIDGISASRMCYVSNMSFNGLAFISKNDGYVYAYDEDSQQIQKISLNDSTFKDIEFNDFSLLGISETDDSIYSFSYTTVPYIRKNSDDVVTNLTIKQKMLDEMDVPIYLSSNEDSLLLQSKIYSFGNFDLTNQEDDFSASISTSGIDCIDYIGYAVESKNNRNFVLVSKENSISAFSLKPVISSTVENDEEKSYFVSVDVIESDFLSDLTDVTEIADLYSVSNPENCYNLIIDDGQLKKKTIEDSLFRIDRYETSSINDVLIDDGTIFLGTNEGLFKAVSIPGNDYGLEPVLEDYSAIKKINNSKDRYLAFTRNDFENDSNNSIYSIGKDSNLVSYIDFFADNVEIVDGNIISTIIRSVSNGDIETSIDDFYDSSTDITAFPFDLNDTKISSLYYNEDDKCVLGTTAGNYVITYSGSNYNIQLDSSLQTSSFQEILSCNASNYLSLYENLSVVNNPFQFVGGNVGGRNINSVDNVSGNAITNDSYIRLIFNGMALESYKNSDSSFSSFSFLINEFSSSFELSSLPSLNDWTLSAVFEISSFNIDGTQSSQSIVSSYTYDPSVPTQNKILFSTEEMEFDDISNIIFNFDLCVASENQTSDELSFDYSFYLDLSSTELINPEFPYLLESGNGFSNRNIEVNENNFTGYIVKHKQSDKYLYLKDVSSLVEIEDLSVYESVDNVFYIYIDKTAINGSFNDAVCFRENNPQTVSFVSPSNRRGKDFNDETEVSMVAGNISKVVCTYSVPYVLDSNSHLYKGSNLFYSEFSKILDNVIDAKPKEEFLYVLNRNNELYKLDSADSLTLVKENVSNFFFSNGRLFYVSNSNLYDEDGNVVEVSSTNGLLNYLSNDNTIIEVFGDNVKYLKKAFDFSKNYEAAFQNDSNNYRRLFSIDNETVLAATNTDLYLLRLNDDGSIEKTLIANGFQNIKAVGLTDENLIVVIDGNCLKISESQYDASLQNYEFDSYEDSSSNMEHIFRATNWSSNYCSNVPLFLAEDGTFCISYEDMFRQEASGNSQLSDENLKRFEKSNSNLYIVGENSIFKSVSDRNWENVLSIPSLDLTDRTVAILDDSEFWTISSDKPTQIKDSSVTSYNIDAVPDDLFRINSSVYYYSNQEYGIYGKDSVVSFHEGGDLELSSKTVGKDVHGLDFLNNKDYVYNFTSSVTGIASAYSGNPTDTWEINANVSLFDSSDPDLCAAVNLEYDTTEATEVMENYKNYVFFSNGGNAYVYNKNIKEGFTVKFDDLENMNNGSSRLLYLGNGYLAYGNLLASFDDFGILIEFGAPSKEFSVLASNFRNGTNTIEVINDNPDFLIGSSFGLKYVYDKLIARSFYDRSNRSNSITGNVALIKSIDKENSYFIASQENELYEITGLKTAKYDKLLTLSSDEVITSIFPFQKDEYLIATTKGIYTTEHKYTIRDDLHSITLSSVYKIINEELAKILSSHIENDHKEDSFITKLNKKADTKLSFLASTDKHVDVTNAELANAVKIVENDIIDTIVRGGEDPSKDTYVKVAVSNWATKAIKTESTYSSGGFVSKFVDPTSEKEFDISTVPYIVKNWKSGLKEIYVYVPTTATYYLNNPQGMSNSQYTYNSTQRKNVPDASVVNTLPNGATMLRVYLYNSYFGIKTILAAQCVGNSLPLKIYKDNVNADDSWKGFFDTVVQPSTLKTLPMTNDGNVNNIRVCTDDQGRIVLDFAVYGTDAQAIRIIAES